MKLENQDLIKEFYESIKDQYPHLDFEEVKLMCVTPFTMVRKEMESGELKTVRLKLFGTFLVYPTRARKVLDKMHKAFKELKLDAKIYFTKKAMLEKYLEKHGTSEDI